MCGEVQRCRSSQPVEEASKAYTVRPYIPAPGAALRLVRCTALCRLSGLGVRRLSPVKLNLVRSLHHFGVEELV
ncbi:hypothetical protein DY000_02050383 [Brassica cretica]|uniref:Uncharacterized protein n=1 Tax=Brassica cretica TaxID=69181 RepID=A0ABQ7EU72_BRACR|nr:hypothetical protein DY000_02050383 [Brassica cretica]